MKKRNAIILIILYILTIVSFACTLFLKNKYLMYLTILLFVLVTILNLLIIHFSQNNKVIKEAKYIIKNNKEITNTLIKAYKLSQAKIIINIEELDDGIYLIIDNLKFKINTNLTNLNEESLDAIYYAFSKFNNKIIYSYNITSLLNYFFNEKLLLKKEYKNIISVDLQIKSKYLTCCKYIILQKGNIECSKDWRNKSN